MSHMGHAEHDLARYERRESAAQDAGDAFDTMCESVEKELIAATERKLAMPDWMNQELPSARDQGFGKPCKESTQNAFEAFCELMDYKQVRPALQALIASEAGAALRTELAKAHAEAQTESVANARVYS